MPCIFGRNDIKIEIGLRKVLRLKRPSKKSPDKVSILYYLPIHKDEVERLGLTKNSLIKAELAVLPELEIEESETKNPSNSEVTSTQVSEAPREPRSQEGLLYAMGERS